MCTRGQPYLYPHLNVPLLCLLCRPSGLTPDPLDYAFCWHLLAVLSAVGALPAATADLPEGAASRDLGRLPGWAAIVSLMPAGPTFPPSAASSQLPLLARTHLSAAPRCSPFVLLLQPPRLA